MTRRTQNLLDEQGGGALLFDPGSEVMHLINETGLSYEEKRVVAEYRRQRVAEYLTAAKAAEAEKLSAHLAQFGTDVYIETVDAIEDNKAKTRHDNNKAYAEEFCHRMKVKAANSLFACHDAGARGILAVARQTLLLEPERQRLTWTERLTGWKQ